MRLGQCQSRWMTQFAAFMLAPAHGLLRQHINYRHPVRPSTRWEKYPAKVPSAIKRRICEAYGADRELIVRSQLYSVFQQGIL